MSMHASPTRIADVGNVLGAETLTWRYAGDNLGYLLSGQALILQVAHPVVGAGVAEHSTYKSDPWGRLARTTAHVSNFIYGGPDVAPRTARHLREMHKDIRGTDSVGRRYHALDPEAYAWVHLTLFHALRSTRRFYVRPLTPSEEACFYEEWLTLGRLLGVREEEMPKSVVAFDRMMAERIEMRLEDNEVVRYLLGPGIHDLARPPFLTLMPERVWRALYFPVGHVVRVATVGSLPEAFREKLALPWTRFDEIAFEILQRLVRIVARPLPKVLRYSPDSRRAFAQARAERVVAET